MEHHSLLTFYCPFQPKIHESVQEVHKHTLQWAADIGLAPIESKRYKRLEVARFAWLTSLTQPYSNLDDLKLAADWHTWLFAHDDIVDATAVGRDPEQVATIHNRLVRILDGDKPGQTDNDIARALADIRRRIASRTDQSWTERFIYSVKQYFEGNNWEAANRAENATPDLATYVKMRQFSGAVFSCFNIIFLTLDFPAESKFLEHVYIQQLAMMSNHHICWVNDIMGLEKEVRERNMSNIVLVLQNMHHLPVDEAIDLSVKFCDWEMEAFIKLEKRLPTFEAAEQPLVEAYLNALKSWMAGHIQWYRETGRYIERPK